MFMFGKPASAAETVRALAGDLDGIAAGEAPTATHLANAPTIRRWRPKLNRRRQAAVTGIVSSDPLLRDGEWIRIDFVAVDPDLAWVRGLLGWYRLGPAEEELESYGQA